MLGNYSEPPEQRCAPVEQTQRGFVNQCLGMLVPHKASILPACLCPGKNAAHDCSAEWVLALDLALVAQEFELTGTRTR